MQSKSFTLIETLVAVTVFTLSLGAVTGIIVFLYRHYYYDWNQAIATDEARRGIESMSREVREAVTGDDGSFALMKAGDKEFIFFSDIDNDGVAERVRYFIGTENSGMQTQECTITANGGTCSRSFAGFFIGNPKSAQVRVSAQGDLGSSNEYAALQADGANLGNICQSGCNDCPGAWQGTSVIDVFSQASDNSISFLADATSSVKRECPASSPTFAMKARWELSWEEEIIGLGNEFKKGVIEPSGSPLTYLTEDEQVTVVTPYVVSDPPVFQYFDSEGNLIEDAQNRLVDTKVMRLFLSINTNPLQIPNNFDLETYVQLRNLKDTI